MARHDAHDPAFDGGLEGDEFERVEPRAVVRKDGEAEVGVRGGVAVAGEVLGRGDNAARLRPLHERADHLGHELGPLAVGADVDDGVLRVVVDVRDGGEDLVHADGPRLLGGEVTGGVGELRVARGAEGHRPRQRRRPLDPHPRPPLHVLRDEQRPPRPALEVVRQDGLLGRLALEEDHPADAEALDEVDEAAVGRAVGAFEVGVGVRGEQLRDLLLNGHLRQRRLGPRVGFRQRTGRRGRFGGEAVGRAPGALAGRQAEGAEEGAERDGSGEREAR